MTVYYLLFLWILYLGALKALTRKYQHTETILVAALAVTLFALAALRATSVGADTRPYASYFLSIAQLRWSELFSGGLRVFGTLEPGYAVYNKLLAPFGSPQTITVANSVLLLGLISAVIFRDSQNRYLSFFLYFTFCFYQTALNLTPSSFVSYFMFLSFPFILQRKLIPFLLFVGIGSLFHLSAVFFLPLYWVGQLPFRRRLYAPALAGGAVLTAFYVWFLPLLLIFLPSAYRYYIDDTAPHTAKTIELLVYAAHLLVILFVMAHLEPQERDATRQKYGPALWGFVIETICYALSSRSSIFARGALLYSPYIVVLIPNLLHEIRDERKRRRVTLCVILYGAALYLVRTKINNVGTTIPYVFFFRA